MENPGVEPQSSLHNMEVTDGHGASLQHKGPIYHLAPWENVMLGFGASVPK